MTNPNLCADCAGGGTLVGGNGNTFTCPLCAQGIKLEVAEGIRSGELVVVPRDPTEAMRTAFQRKSIIRASFAECYADMIAAAEGE